MTDWVRSTDPTTASDPVDAIDFYTDDDVIPARYRLWGVSGTSTSLQVTICLYRGSSLLVAEKSTSSFAARTSVRTFEVHFSQVISIRTGVKYATTARISRSKNTFCRLIFN